MALDEKSIYNDTINESKDASLAKAMAIMMEDIEKQQVKQQIVRPKVSTVKGVIFLLLYVVGYTVAVILLTILLGDSTLYKTISIIAATIIWIFLALICMKRFLIWTILMYQKYAPEDLRKQCYFEPSCSEYMKLSIQKYGVIKGVKKGCDRLCRCHWPNGGKDYP